MITCIILIPIAFMVWFEVFRLLQMEIKGTGQSYEHSVLLKGITDFSSLQMNGELEGWIIMAGLLGVLIFILARKPKRGKDSKL